MKDEGENPKVGQCGAAERQLPFTTWKSLLAEPSLLTSQGVLGCDGCPLTPPFPLTMPGLFF